MTDDVKGKCMIVMHVTRQCAKLCAQGPRLHSLRGSDGAVRFKENPSSTRTVYIVRTVYMSMTNFPANMTRCWRSRTRRPVSISCCAVSVSTDANAERCAELSHEKSECTARHAAAHTCALMLERMRSCSLRMVRQGESAEEEGTSGLLACRRAWKRKKGRPG